MRVVITGTTGFLGSHLVDFFYNNKKSHYEIFTLNNREINQVGVVKNYVVDIINTDCVYEVLSGIKPNAIIHCAALSKPDFCELNKELCLQTNFFATQNIVKFSKEHHAHLVFLSTDFVFIKGENITEEMQCEPVNYYAKSKWLSEQFIEEYLSRYSIIRPVFMYGKPLQNAKGCFVQWVENKLKLNEPFLVVNDQYRTPTYVIDVCMIIELLLKQSHFGKFHVCGNEILTPYEFAIQIAQTFSYNTNLIKPVSKNEFKEIAARPERMILSNQKVKSSFHFKPTLVSDFLKNALS